MPHSQVEVPFVILAENAYPLHAYIIKLYKRKELTEIKRRFNDRLPRAIKTAECEFGITYAKWRILSKSIETSVNLAEKIVKGVGVLHNTIIDRRRIGKASYRSLQCQVR